MSSRRHCPEVVVLLFLSLLVGGVTLAQDAPFRFSLGPAVSLTPDSLVASLSFFVQTDHHLYRERMAVKAAAGTLRVSWPEPHRITDPFEGKPVDVYEAGTFTLGLGLSQWPAVSSVAVTLAYHGCSSQSCFMPAEETFFLELPVKPPVTAPVTAASASTDLAVRPPTPAPLTTAPPPATPPMSVQEAPSGPPAAGIVVTPGGSYDFDRTLHEHGLAWALLIAFFGGFLVSLTPCVYPMIPITLSIIGGRQENTSFGRGLGLSLTYVAGLSLTYATLGLVVALFGAHIRGVLQGPVFQLVMAGIFVLLALSMFDLFLLQVPDALRQRFVGVRKTGLGGIFLLGMISGLMASPCIAAPLAGILAFIAASGSLLLGFTMLLSFAWGMGLILVLIGAFSGSLNALPRAGDWMVKVKEFYGFLLLGAAFYFAHPFIGAPWAELLTAALLAAFAGFLGLFSPMTPEAALGERVTRCLGVVALAVACAFGINAASQWGGLTLSHPGPETVSTGEAAMPFWHDRLADGLALARREKKPVLVDFRADWCTICKELEREVFPDPDVAPLLRGFALVRIDSTAPTPEADLTMRQYGVVGLPTLLILDSEGRSNNDLRMVGAVTTAALAKNLRAGLR